jgi:hypothetical protein
MKTYTYFVMTEASRYTQKQVLGVIKAKGILEADKIFEAQTGKNPIKGGIQCSIEPASP